MIVQILVSLIAGVMCGMGMGGGVLLIPALMWLGWQQLSAQTANLIAYLPAVMLAVWQHHKQRRVDWKSVLYLSLTGVPAALLGALAASLLSTSWLRNIFGVFLVGLAVKEWISAGKISDEKSKKKPARSK